MTVLPIDLRLLRDDLRAAATRIAAGERRRRRALVAITVLAALAACVGAAVAAVGLLGRPAPSGVQHDLHRAARFTWGGHSILQTQKAIVVAQSTHATLYSVRDDRGNYCAELIGMGETLIFGFACNTSRRLTGGETVFDDAGTNVQYDIPHDGVDPPVVQFGRLPPGAVAARAVYGNGLVDRVHLGLDGFFVYEPTGRRQELARELPVTLEFLDRGGRPIWSWYAQPSQPLVVRGNSIRGRIVIRGAARVRLNVWPGSPKTSLTTFVPIDRNGRFVWRGRPGDRAYMITVVDRSGLQVSADAEPLTHEAVRQMAALIRRNR